MRRLRLVGIGTGDPDQVTVEAVRALNEVDVFLVTDKVTEQRGVDDLVALRQAVLERHVTRPHRVVVVPDPPRDRTPASYDRAVGDWHEARAAAWERVLLDEVRPEEVAGLLVWGDPMLYDSTIRVVERVLERGAVSFEWTVLPGISSVQVLAARHRIVLNRVGAPVTVTTGRRLLETVAAGADDVVVMLDGALTCGSLAGEWDVWWGADLGTPDEALVAGRLAAVLPEIRAVRERVRERRGWVMDTYLLRRAGS